LRPGSVPESANEGRAEWAAFWVAAFGVFIAADDLMVVATMLRPMIADVGLRLPDDLDSTAWIVNVYLIAYITAMPLAGRLSDVVGRRPVFVGGLAVFIVGSLIVPSTDSFAVLLVGRILSAVGGGALVPVAFAVAADVYKGAKLKRSLGTLGAIETLGWVWGPLYGAVLVRFLSWEWQFYLNVPLGLVAMFLGWRFLAPGVKADRSIDWLGAALLTVGLVAINIALLDQAKIQTVGGLEELTGASAAFAGPWLFVVAVFGTVGFAVVQRRRSAGGPVEPIVAWGLLQRTGPGAALVVNALVGVGLAIALVNVPLFVNIVESGTGRGLRSTALLAGWLLTALTASMAVMSYAGGALSARFGNVLPTALGCGLAAFGLGLMGSTWSADPNYGWMAAQLLLVGTGIGLVLGPSSAAVVGVAAAAERGSAAGLVIMARLVGFSVGLAGLTAWGVRRFKELRGALELPVLGEPGYETAIANAATDITTTALAETFLGAGLALAVAFAVGFLMASKA